MIVALVALAGVATGVSFVAVVTLADQLRKQIREAARERQVLVNQIMHLAGRTWQPPPAPPAADGDEERDLSLYVPSGMPDLYEGDEG